MLNLTSNLHFLIATRERRNGNATEEDERRGLECVDYLLRFHVDQRLSSCKGQKSCSRALVVPIRELQQRKRPHSNSHTSTSQWSLSQEHYRRQASLLLHCLWPSPTCPPPFRQNGQPNNHRLEPRHQRLRPQPHALEIDAMLQPHALC